MTQEVLNATCLCLLAQAEEAERLDSSEEEADRFIIEEFGRCLVQIIECATKTEGLLFVPGGFCFVQDVGRCIQCPMKHVPNFR
jgi:hypothetical protein